MSAIQHASIYKILMIRFNRNNHAFSNIDISGNVKQGSRQAISYCFKQ